MCVLAFAFAAHPRWRIVLAGNRDEYHARPAAPLARWADRPDVLAGRDLASGGAWLGLSVQGRLSVVTNVRGFGAADPARVSRGRLVTDMLTGGGAFGDAATAALGDFNPFNLIVAEAGRAAFLSNRPGPISTGLAPGLYGLSNGALDEPWPKTMRLKAHLLDWLNAGTRPPAALFDGLREEAVPQDGLRPATPSDIAQEPRLSAIFINDPVYGTRCSTVVAIDRNGAGVILERRYDAEARVTGTTELAFAWPASG